jgi:hypothetical protein
MMGISVMRTPAHQDAKSLAVAMESCGLPRKNVMMVMTKMEIAAQLSVHERGVEMESYKKERDVMMVIKMMGISARIVA